nr:regulatory-associated protein of TOR 1 [Tanacetum cinerariifolium]
VPSRFGEGQWHTYFIRFLDSVEAYPKQRVMAAFVLIVIVDGHQKGKEACIEANMIAGVVFALGTLLNVGFDSPRDVGDNEYDVDEKVPAEISIVKSLLNVVSDGIFNRTSIVKLII